MHIKYEQSGNLFAIKQYTVSTLVWYGMYYDEMNASAMCEYVCHSEWEWVWEYECCSRSTTRITAVNEHAYRSDEAILLHIYEGISFFAYAKCI